MSARALRWATNPSFLHPVEPTGHHRQNPPCGVPSGRTWVASGPSYKRFLTTDPQSWLGSWSCSP